MTKSLSYWALVVVVFFFAGNYVGNRFAEKMAENMRREEESARTEQCALEKISELATENANLKNDFELLRQSFPDAAPANVAGIFGTASWYDYDLDEPDQICRDEDCTSYYRRTCASRDFPRGTWLRIISLEDNTRMVECLVNDYVEHPERKIDLSSYAFEHIAPLQQGLVNVLIEPL